MIDKRKGLLFSVIIFVSLALYLSVIQSLATMNNSLNVKIRTLQSSLSKKDLDVQALNSKLQEYKSKYDQLHQQIDKENQVSRGSSKSPGWSTFVGTFYDNQHESTGKYPNNSGYGITASGRHTQEGITIAVDPRVIPLGTWVEIAYNDPFTGEIKIEKRRADDTGGAIKGNKIDIYLANCNGTNGRFDKQKIQLRIIE
ncbi:MAG: 3D domain-containing protein [Bacteroidota bacterium]|nr:3D domain-containing protein [Bacteroidota bacterium]